MGTLHAQTSDSLTKFSNRKFNETSGLTAYYFWQEEKDGVIDTASFNQPYLQNFTISWRKNEATSAEVPQKEWVKAIDRLANNPEWDPNYHYPVYRLFHASERRLNNQLKRVSSNSVGSVVFRSHDGKWEVKEEKRVLYFVVNHQQLRFSHSSDSLIIPDWKLLGEANGQYKVVRYENETGKTDSVKVYRYNGQEITQILKRQDANKAVSVLLLINGYRGPKTNKDPGDGLLTQKDRFYYWYRIDNRFQELLQPAVTFYIDGSFPIHTSNHRNRLRFGVSWLRTKLTPKHQDAPRVYKRLTEKPNPEGFDVRKEAGRLAGKVFLSARCQFPLVDEVKDTIDVVSHSMGYAYSLGFLEVVEPYVVLRNAYIVAPENAMQEGYDWSKFQHAWQYGSNLGEPNADPLREQDGIAPQVAAKGLDQLPPEKGGRLFIPTDWPHKNFVDSHMIYSFDWIFDRIAKGQPGYVGK